jgi:hypothetical protein
MMRFENQPVRSQVQVVDAQKNPVDTAQVFYTVKDAIANSEPLAWGERFSGTMHNIGDGIYDVMWTPDHTGHWLFEAFSYNPKFRQSFLYFIRGQSNTAFETSYPMPDFSLILPNDTDEHDILIIGGDYTLSSFAVDLTPLVQNAIIRHYAMIRGNWILVEQKTFPTDFPTNAKCYILPVVFPVNNERVTIQSVVAQGSDLTLWYSILGILLSSWQTVFNPTSERG